jgi:hypothetical protein
MWCVENRIKSDIYMNEPTPGNGKPMGYKRTSVPAPNGDRIASHGGWRIPAYYVTRGRL